MNKSLTGLEQHEGLNFGVNYPFKTLPAYDLFTQFIWINTDTYIEISTFLFQRYGSCCIMAILNSMEY